MPRKLKSTEPRSRTFGLRATPQEYAVLRRAFPNTEAALEAARGGVQLEFHFATDYPSAMPSAAQIAAFLNRLSL